MQKKIYDKFWRILDRFACWLSNQCWQRLYKKKKYCKCQDTKNLKKK